MASIVARRFAATVFATEACIESNPVKKRELEREAAAAWTGAHHG
jgi:hypothetical protein